MNKAIHDYLAALPELRRQRLTHIHERITALVPAVVQSMKYKMPTYELGDHWLSIGNQKAHISVYTCKPELIAPYLKKHPKISAGKGCLRFRDSQDLVLDDLRIVIEKALL